MVIQEGMTYVSGNLVHSTFKFWINFIEDIKLAKF